MGSGTLTDAIRHVMAMSPEKRARASIAADHNSGTDRKWPGEVALIGSANASLTLAGAGSANEQLAAAVRGKLATTEEGPSGSFRGALS